MDSKTETGEQQQDSGKLILYRPRLNILKLTYIYAFAVIEFNVENATAIVDFKTNYPIVSYSGISRRNNTLKCKKSLDELLSSIAGWSKHKEIAIDGVNGVGKSRLVSNLNRQQVKINHLLPQVTSGSSYNYDVFKSIEYMMMPLSLDLNYCVWDRCVYSNLIFYFVHYLMSVFQNDEIPMDHDAIISIFNKLATDIDLISILTVTKEFKDIPTLFIVCRDLNVVAISLFQRESLNDMWNATQRNYQAAQYHAYVYFAKVLDIPIFDVIDFQEFGMSIGDMQVAIGRIIDIDATETLTLDDAKISAIFQAEHKLRDQLNRLSDSILLYDYSRK